MPKAHEWRSGARSDGTRSIAELHTATDGTVGDKDLDVGEETRPEQQGNRMRSKPNDYLLMSKEGLYPAVRYSHPG